RDWSSDVCSSDLPLVARHPREGHEVVVLGLERRWIAAGLAVLDVDVLPRCVVRPAVIRTDVVFGVALLGGAQHRALVAAYVDECAEAPFRVARREHRRPPDMARNEVV